MTSDLWLYQRPQHLPGMKIRFSNIFWYIRKLDKTKVNNQPQWYRKILNQYHETFDLFANIFRYQLDSKTVNQPKVGLKPTDMKIYVCISHFPVLVRGHRWQPPNWVMLKKFVKPALQETEVEIEEAMFNLCREIEIIQTQMPKLYKIEMVNLIWNSGKLIFRNSIRQISLHDFECQQSLGNWIMKNVLSKNWGIWPQVPQISGPWI